MACEAGTRSVSDSLSEGVPFAMGLLDDSLFLGAMAPHEALRFRDALDLHGDYIYPRAGAVRGWQRAAHSC